MIDIFDLLEFQVLAAARGIEDYYGFTTGEEAASEDVYYTVYQMTRSGILKQEGEALVIQPPASCLMDEIAAAAYVLVIDQGQYELPRQCIYHSRGPYVCLESCSTDPSKISLYGMDWESFILQLKDLYQLPPPDLTEEVGDYDFAGYWEDHIPKGLKRLLEAGCQAEIEDFLDCPQIYSVFTLRDKINGKIFKRMVLLDLALEFCMALQEDGAVSLERYPPERAEKVLEAWWRDEG